MTAPRPTALTGREEATAQLLDECRDVSLILRKAVLAIIRRLDARVIAMGNSWASLLKANEVLTAQVARLREGLRRADTAASMLRDNIPEDQRRAIDEHWWRLNNILRAALRDAEQTPS